MKTFFITLGLATLLILLAAIALGIGRLITGHSKFSCKRCGSPEKKEGCGICKKKPKAK